MKTIHTLLAVALLALGATQISCSVNDYCLNCGTDDGGMGDGDAMDGGDANDAGDAGIDASCVPTGSEECDGVDNDCNGLIDDGTIATVGNLCDEQDGTCNGGTIFCDSTAGMLKCTKAPMPEECDGLDNNCNGMVDEGDPEGGAKCGTDMGACVAGVERCQGGSVVCTGFEDHTGDSELCNGQDDDCDGFIDDNIGSLGTCGPAEAGVGICVAGTLNCVGGVPTCEGAVFPKGVETCNMADDNCNGTADEGFNTNTDPLNCGGCAGMGGMVCPIASKTCINSANAGAPCTMDSECTGGTGPQQCVVNSIPRCAGGTCDVRCNGGFHDLNGSDTDGCEYKCSPTGGEVCDGLDNDCDGLTDTDDPNMAAAPTGLCLTQGECANTSPTCTGNGGWVCNYTGAVEFPEASCDNRNNDCDANVDERHKPDTLGHVKDAICFDNDPGECRDQGTYQCSTTAPTGPLECIPSTDAPEPGDLRESCNAKDDDCDGTVDENNADSTLDGQSWVDIGGGRQMMQYEASRPDAIGTNPGVNESIACSRAGSAPWTNVTYVEAQAACAALGGGARLCSEQEWHRTCSDVSAPTFPIVVATAGTLIEAENYSAIATGTQLSTAESGAQCAAGNNVDDDGDNLINDGCPANGAAETICDDLNDSDSDTFFNDGCPANVVKARAWSPDYTVAPGDTSAAGMFSGISAMEPTPNTNRAAFSATQAATQAPRLDYSISVAQAGTYSVYVRMFSNNANDDTVYVGVNGFTTRTATTGAHGIWQWRLAGGTFALGAGTFTLSIWMGDDGTKIDQVYVTTGAAPVDPTRAALDASHGNTWAYLPSSSANTYAGSTCNGDDFDTNAGIAGDQDDIIATGSLTSCAADVGTGVFDMSGNVKEWTLARQPGENPLRGGASNNSSVGISCALNFTLADDALILPNIGFRCCR